MGVLAGWLAIVMVVGPTLNMNPTSIFWYFATVILGYVFTDTITTKYGIKFPASFKDYEDWLDKNFIVFDELAVKRDIVTKVVTQCVKTTNTDHVYKAIRLNIKEVEAHYGKSFTKKRVDLDANA